MAEVLQPEMTLSNWTASTVDITISSPYASGTFELRLAINEPTGLSFVYNNADRSTWIKGTSPTNAGEWVHTFSQALTGTGNNTITITGVDVNQPYVAYGWCDNGAGSTSDVALVRRSAPYQNYQNRRIRISDNTQETVYGITGHKIVSGGAQSSISFALNDIANAGDAIFINLYYDNVPNNFLVNRTPSMTSDLFTNSTGGNIRWYEYELDNWLDNGTQDTFSGDWNDQGNLPSAWCAIVVCVANGLNNYDREGLTASPSSFSTEVAGPPRLWRERLDTIIGGLTRGHDVGWCYFYVGDATTITTPPYIEAYNVGDQPPLVGFVGTEVNANSYRAFGLIRGEAGQWGNRDWLGYIKLETADITPTPAFWQRLWLPEPAVWSNPDFSASTFDQIIVSGDANWPYGYVFWAVYSADPGSPTLTQIKAGQNDAGSTATRVTNGNSPTVTAGANTTGRLGAFTFTTAAVLTENTQYWVVFFLENHERSTIDSRDAFKTNIYNATYTTPDGPDEEVITITEQLVLTGNPATVTQGYRPPVITSVFPDIWQDGLQNIVVTTDNVTDHTATRAWVFNRPMPITARTRDTLTITADQQDLLDDTDYRLVLTDYSPSGQIVLDREDVCLAAIAADPFESDVVFQFDCDDVPIATNTTVLGWGYMNTNKVANYDPPNTGFGLNLANANACQLIDDPSEALWGRKYVRSRNLINSPGKAFYGASNGLFPDHSSTGTMTVNFIACWEFWFRFSDEYINENAETRQIFNDLEPTFDNGWQIVVQREGYTGGADPIGATGVSPESIANGYLGVLYYGSGTPYVVYPPADPVRLMHRGLGWMHLAVQRNGTGQWDIWLRGKHAMSFQENPNVQLNFNQGYTGDAANLQQGPSQFDWKAIRVTKDVVRYTEGVDFEPQLFRPLKAWAD